MDKDLMTFRSIVDPTILKDTTIRCYIGAKPWSLEKWRSIVLVYVAAFFIGFILSLRSLVLQVLSRVGAHPYHLSLNFWRVLDAIAFLNHTFLEKHGINELLHVYALWVIDDWFDLELRKGQAWLVKLPWPRRRMEQEYAVVDYDPFTMERRSSSS